MTKNLPKITRRQFSSEFKAGIVSACQQPGASVAQIAMSHGINANLVHKWIRNTKPSKPSQASFIALPTPPSGCEKVTFTIPCAQGTITVEWPIDQVMQSVQWLKAVRS